MSLRATLVSVLASIAVLGLARAQEHPSYVQTFERVCLAAIETQTSPSALAEAEGLSALSASPMQVGIRPATPLSRIWANLADPAQAYVVTAVTPAPYTHFSCMVSAPDAAVDASVAIGSRLLERGYVLNTQWAGNGQPGIIASKYDRQVHGALFSVQLVRDERSSPASFRAISYCVGCAVPTDGQPIN